MTAPTQTPATAGADVPMPETATPQGAPPQQPPVFVRPGDGGAAGTPPTFVKPTGYDGPPAPKAFALAVLALAFFAALLLAEQPAGLGLAVLCGGLIAAVWTLIERRDAFVVAVLACAAVLGAVPAFRDSDWVVTLSLLGSLTLTSIAAAQAVTWRETAIGTLGWIAKLAPAPVVFFAEGVRRASSRRWSLAGPVARGTMLAAFLVFAFGALFSAADAQFAQLVRDLTDWDLDLGNLVVRAIVFGVVLALAGSLWLVTATRRDRPAKPAKAQLGRTEWTIALGAVVVLFAGFVALQLPELFGGDRLVQLTDGLTYADNARTGFVQLTFAAILTLGVVAGAVRYGPAGDLAVRLLSGALCLLTVVVLASALHRLGLYADAYGATRTRFSLHKLMLWLGAVLLLVVLAGGLRRTALLPRAIVLVSAVFAIGTVALNPDGRVADRNVDRYLTSGTIDTGYLATLSADALPSLRALPVAAASCVGHRIERRTMRRSDPIVGVNAGRIRARHLLHDLPAPAVAPTTCAPEPRRR